MADPDPFTVNSPVDAGIEKQQMIGARPLDPTVITGTKYLGRLFSLMDRLAQAGCERDSAGNRHLLFSQYAGLMLLGMFNPTLQSLRGLSVPSEVPSGDCICSSRSIANSPNMRHLRPMRRVVTTTNAVSSREIFDPTASTCSIEATNATRCSTTFVLLTNLLDVPADVIAALYELRWSIELFFRFFKHVLGCRQLLSHKPEGVMIQVYCALIAALLMSLTLGDSVGRRGFELICLYLQGWAEEDELLDGLRRLSDKTPKKI